LLVMISFFLPVFFPTDVQAESNSEKWIKKVKLKKNAKANGFKITFKSSKIYFVAIKVTDPGTKKLVEGEQILEYRCKETDKVMTITLTFIGGNSNNIQITCTELITAQIIIMNEEESPLPPPIQ
jgi:hypothetical protein